MILAERCSTFWAPAWPAPPGWPGLRLKWAKGRFGSKNDEKVKVLRMEFSIVENISGLQESIFNLSRGPQLHFGEKSKNWSNFIKFTNFPLSPCLGSLGLLSSQAPRAPLCIQLPIYDLTPRPPGGCYLTGTLAASAKCFLTEC